MATFWKPGEAGPTLDVKTGKYEAETTTTFHYNPNVSRDIRRQRLLLPIKHFREGILYHVANYSTVIILGLSGCGKSTQIPQYLYESGWASNNNIKNNNNNNNLGNSSSSSSTTTTTTTISSVRNSFASSSQIIASVQPTRTAALMLASRIAEESGSSVGKGGIVGCNVQYFPHVDNKTCKIKILTNEMILREVYRDPLLLKYSVIIIDQIDERTTDMDILFGVVKNIKKKRPNLRLILCAATTSAVKLKDFFDENNNIKVSSSNNNNDNDLVNDDNKNVNNNNNTTDNNSTSIIICVSHKSEQSQVSTYYLDNPCGDFIKATVRAVLSIINGNYDNDGGKLGGNTSNTGGNRSRNDRNNVQKNDGGILVFMPGKFEVETTVRWLKDELLPYDNSFQGNLYKSNSNNNNNRHNNNNYNNTNNRSGTSTTVLPLHSKLSNNEQLRCFLKPRNGERKIIVATNIAETSLTVPGITYVIDTMFTRFSHYNAETGKQSIVTTPISQLSATQRANRAGRNVLKSGKCFRLCTESAFMSLKDESIPEICRSNLIQQCLYLKSIGIVDFSQFSFLDMPHIYSFARAFEALHALGAINMDGTLTTFGQTISRFQCSPYIAKVLLNSLNQNCTEEILTICAMLQIKNVFVYPRNQEKLKEATEVFKAFASEHGSDHLTLLTVYNQFTGILGRSSRKWSQINFCNHNALLRAKSIRKEMALQLKKSIPPGQNFPSCGEDDTEPILKCILSGFFINILAKEKGDYVYKTVKDNRVVKFDKYSMLEMFPTNVEDPPQWIMYYDAYDAGINEGEIVYNLSIIPDIQWLMDVASHYYHLKHSKYSLDPNTAGDYLKDFKVDYSLVEDGGGGGGGGGTSNNRRRRKKKRGERKNVKKASNNLNDDDDDNNNSNNNMRLISAADRSSKSPSIYNDDKDLKNGGNDGNEILIEIEEDEEMKKKRLQIKKEEEERRQKKRKLRKRRRELKKKKRKMTVAELLGGHEKI